MADDRESRLLEARRALLSAVLPHVAFDGWTDRAMRRAAADSGLDPASARLAFPGGPTEAIAFWSREADRAMAGAYASVQDGDMRLRARIAFLVRARIEAVAAHREAVRRALVRLAQPRHAGLGARCLYRTVDEMWNAAGSRATDFSFYTRRLTLAGVYSSTLLYWLDDASQDGADSWDFLDRRIEGVMRIPSRRRKLQQLRRDLPNPGRFARLVRERLREDPARD